MQLSFTKMQGVGNDYLYVDDRQQKIKQPARLAVRLADRHFGVGSDGLVLLQTSTVADVKMVMYNADGSEGLMCGNAVRCIAKYVRDHQWVTGRDVKIETKSGVKVVRSLGQDLYRVQMGEPRYDLAQPINQAMLLAVQIGNPHVVVFCDFDVAAYDIKRLGSRIEHSSLFPGGVNVEFVRVVAPNVLQMRVWERGSGETLGCGTGACAAAVAAVVRGLCDRQQLIRVQLPGGELFVDYHRDDIALIGPAVTVFQGEITLAEVD